MRLAPIVLVLASAFGVRAASAGGPAVDGGADARAGDGGKLLAPSGAPCNAHADCRSNACMSGTCRARCDATTKCPTTQACTRGGVCMPKDAGSTEPALSKRPADDDDAEDEEEAIEKDEEYWRSLPTSLEPPPDNRKGCSSTGTPLDADMAGGLFCASAAAIALLRRKPRLR